MPFVDSFFSRENHFSVGTETDTGRRYLSIPVTIGIADYEEYYEISVEHAQRFSTEVTAGAAFAEECRRREHDDLLLLKPGWNRGVAY